MNPGNVPLSETYTNGPWSLVGVLVVDGVRIIIEAALSAMCRGPGRFIC
jgi:hypothetical protein